MTATSLFLALSLIACAAVPGRGALDPADAKRPVVLLVHGRGFLSRDSVEFRRKALHALREGAFRATGDSLLADDDIRLVWYADLLDVRRRGAQAATSCILGGAAEEPGISPSFILRSLALMASELVDATATDSARDGARDLAGDLRFVGDATARCAAEGRVANAIARARAEGRPVVIVAHSLGALVAWGHLEHRGTVAEQELPKVQRLVTVGSPIGNSGLRELLYADTAEVTLPRGVRSWINAVNADDPFASRLVTTDSVTGRVRALRHISDIETGHSDEDAHDLRGYLRDASTARAVVSAWCEAAEMRARIAGCVALSRQ